MKCIKLQKSELGKEIWQTVRGNIEGEKVFYFEEVEPAEPVLWPNDVSQAPGNII